MLNPLFFTVCSLAEYPSALALGRSIHRQIPGAKFWIGLADRLERLPAHAPRPFPVADVEKIDLPDLAALTGRYTWLEFLHLTRPFFARYFLEIEPSTESLFFLGPECSFMAPPTAALTAFSTASIGLFPQRLTPPADPTRLPAERLVLNEGVYQGAAWALRRGPEAERFLTWWSARLHSTGFLNLCEGYGLDQLWFNLVPAFFEEVLCLREPGYGLSVVNADERQLVHSPSGWEVNDVPLVLVNWTGFDFRQRRWANYLTNRRTETEWDELAREYESNRPFDMNLSKLTPTFGRAYQPRRTPIGRYRITRPLRRIVAWIDRFQP
ncbi:MAG: hypothetical protein H7Y12_09525 [Sphingobacteriaceae bacterium]|nr:hypothetical protein [Cytophagaceae bacterium]